MTNNKKDAASNVSPSAVGPSESCTLELSADGKWMRLIVGGRLTSAFNVEYVRKVLGDTLKESKRPSRRNSEMPVGL